MFRRARGITLIELLVVMAIVSVLLAFVGPSMSAGMDNLILTSVGRRLVSVFRLAQNSARTSGQRVFATYDESSFRFLKGDQPYQTVTMPRGVRMITPEKKATFVLLESGQIVGPDVIELTNGRGRRIQLSIDHGTGFIKLAGGR